MKNNILLINACARSNSRTAELTHHLLNCLDGEITEVNLYQQQLSVLDEKGIKHRETQSDSDDSYQFAKQFRDADTIVISAPFWDLSFPAVLKIYLENITISGITFAYSKEGRPIGKCKAKRLYYITTSGGYIGENNFGFDYVKALAQNFFGISQVHFFSAEGLDMDGADVETILKEAKARITFH